MNALVHSSVLLDMIGQTWSRLSVRIFVAKANSDRIKEKLRSGQLQVAGDQWPIFLYANYVYDQDDPWNGLLHSGILISVSRISFCAYTQLWLIG